MIAPGVSVKNPPGKQQTGCEHKEYDRDPCASIFYNHIKNQNPIISSQRGCDGFLKYFELIFRFRIERFAKTRCAGPLFKLTQARWNPCGLKCEPAMVLDQNPILDTFHTMCKRLMDELTRYQFVFRKWLGCNAILPIAHRRCQNRKAQAVGIRRWCILKLRYCNLTFSKVKYRFNDDIKGLDSCMVCKICLEPKFYLNWKCKKDIPGPPY